MSRNIATTAYRDGYIVSGYYTLPEGYPFTYASVTCHHDMPLMYAPVIKQWNSQSGLYYSVEKGNVSSSIDSAEREAEDMARKENIPFYQYGDSPLSKDGV